MDISTCESCTEDCPQAQGRYEAAIGRMYAMRELAKSAQYWDGLFDESDKPKITPARLRELVEADLDGRCVVLPFPMHKMLFDMSDPIRPEILKDFRISATWDHCGIVFHSPWNIFLENVEKGHIRIIHESVEAKLKGDPPC